MQLMQDEWYEEYNLDYQSEAQEKQENKSREEEMKSAKIRQIKVHMKDWAQDIIGGVSHVFWGFHFRFY